MRIVSLIASATEIVCALGLEKQLVGISHECDAPPDVVKNLPRISRPKIRVDQKSAVIDRDVRHLVQQGLSVYEIDVDRLVSLKPDLIVTQDHCEVCAVSLKDVKEALCQVAGFDTNVCSLRPHSLADIFDSILQVGEVADVLPKAEQIVTTLRRRLDVIAKRTQSISSKPRVLAIEWLEPPMLAGLWIPEIIALAGGESVLVGPKEIFKTVDWKTVEDADPDVIVIFPCGFTVERTLKELKGSKGAEVLKKMRATKEGRCFICDGNALFDRPGPRIVDSAELLTGLLHPHLFPNMSRRFRAFYQIFNGKL